jgi:hypothetical protein
VRINSYAFLGASTVGWPAGAVRSRMCLGHQPRRLGVRDVPPSRTCARSVAVVVEDGGRLAVERRMSGIGEMAVLGSRAGGLAGGRAVRLEGRCRGRRQPRPDALGAGRTLISGSADKDRFYNERPGGCALSERIRCLVGLGSHDCRAACLSLGVVDRLRGSEGVNGRCEQCVR